MTLGSQHHINADIIPAPGKERQANPKGSLVNQTETQAPRSVLSKGQWIG